jgi:hypothetical protein
VSVESLVLLVIFIVLPLLERLMKLLREHQANQRPPSSEMPVPPPAPPVRPPRRQPRPEVQSSGPGRPPGTPPGRRLTSRPPTEASSLEAEATSALEGQPIAARPITTAPDGLPGLPRRRRAPRINLRQPASLQAAIVAQTVLGPCRATRPYDSGPDI